ncbi:hypothetical protein BGM09_07985 [Streptomyces sp. CBMA29]|nr:hypothetical protein [Streptomyces sp. CBMA29]
MSHSQVLTAPLGVRRSVRRPSRSYVLVVRVGQRAAVDGLPNRPSEGVVLEQQFRVRGDGASEPVGRVVLQVRDAVAVVPLDGASGGIPDVTRRLTGAVDPLDELACGVVDVPDRPAVEVRFAAEHTARIVVVGPLSAGEFVTEVSRSSVS